MVKVFCQNLGKYNEGQIVGDWIQLPTTNVKIDEFLKDVVGLNEEYEEYMIADYDLSEKLSFIPKDEYCNIHDLNLLAKQISMISQHDLRAVSLYMQDAYDFELEEILNVCVQKNKLVYFDYDFEGAHQMMNRGVSEEKMLGYQLANNNGLTRALKRYDVDYCFDFEKYGLDQSIDLNIAYTKEGYLRSEDCSVDVKRYSMDELYEMIDKEYDDSISLNNRINSVCCNKENLEDKVIAVYNLEEQER